MAVTSTPVFVQTPKLIACQFLQGTDAADTYKAICTGGTNGTKVTALWATNSDSITHLFTLQLTKSASAVILYGGLAITLPITAGFVNAIPAVNLLAATNWPGLPIDSDGNPFLFLESGDAIRGAFTTALNTSKVVNVLGIAGDF